MANGCLKLSLSRIILFDLKLAMLCKISGRRKILIIIKS